MTSPGRTIAVVGGPDLPIRLFGPAARAAFAERAVAAGPGVDLLWALGGPGAAFVAPIGAAFAQALAGRIAGGVGRPVRWFAARMPDPARVAADLAEGAVRPDGRPAPAPDPVAAEWSTDLSSRCDDKPWFLLSGLAEAVLERWGLAGSASEGWVPAAFADPRVAAVAADLRASARAEVAVVDGRSAVRVWTPDGAVSTTFLDVERLAAVRAAFPALLAASGRTPPRESSRSSG